MPLGGQYLPGVKRKIKIASDSSKKNFTWLTKRDDTLVFHRNEHLERRKGRVKWLLVSKVPSAEASTQVLLSCSFSTAQDKWFEAGRPSHIVETLKNRTEWASLLRQGEYFLSVYGFSEGGKDDTPIRWPDHRPLDGTDFQANTLATCVVPPLFLFQPETPADRFMVIKRNDSQATRDKLIADGTQEVAPSDLPYDTFWRADPPKDPHQWVDCAPPYPWPPPFLIGQGDAHSASSNQPTSWDGSTVTQLTLPLTHPSQPMMFDHQMGASVDNRTSGYQPAMSWTSTHAAPVDISLSTPGTHYPEPDPSLGQMKVNQDDLLHNGGLETQLPQEPTVFQGAGHHPAGHHQD